MNAEHPADYAPLSYGAALTVGLMLILGLPGEEKPARIKSLAPPQKNSTSPIAAASAPAIGGMQHTRPAGALR